MRKSPRNWPAIAIVLLGVFCAFATGGWIATKFVSPCVCVHVQGGSIQ